MSEVSPDVPIQRKPFEGEMHDLMAGAARWEVKVHDHGLVALIDVMPRFAPVGKTADYAIVQAARVSYGEGTKQVNEDSGLIRYLARHRHTTPFEMVEFKFHHVMPIFVARQWIRHRTACLAEGTEVYFDLPGGVRRRGNQLYKIRVEDLAQRWEPTRNTQRPDKQRDPLFRRNRIREMRLRQINEDTLQLQRTRVVNVYRNGRKPVFRLILADGKQIEATADHQFLFADGWQTLHAATGLCEHGERAIWSKGDHFLYVNGAVLNVPSLHRDPQWLDDQYNARRQRIADIASACGVSYHTIRKWLAIHGLQHESGGRPSQSAWNQGKRYELGPRDLSPAWREANRRARSGPASNFWRGGITPDRANIGRWTTQIAAKIHRQNSWTCQLCRTRPEELHCHHVVPVWADISLARAESNLTTLCGKCHRAVQGKELEFVERLGGPPVKAEWRRKPRVTWNKLTVAKLVRVERFEYVGEKETFDLEVEGPYHNFIANGIVTHNSVNEYSARYSVVRDRFYHPSLENVRKQSAANRQGGDEPIEPATAQEFLSYLDRVEKDYEQYQHFIEKGVAREIARIALPASVYTEWYWKIDLHNLFHFLSLRMDAHAQQEIRDYANAMFALIRPIVPIAAQAFLDYNFEAMHLTRLEIESIRTGQPLATANKRETAEWEEKRKKLGL
jgi:thymidylate synthase (FAD)